MAKPRWLNERQQHLWHGFRHVNQDLFAVLEQHLARESRLSGADYKVLHELSVAPDGLLRARDLGCHIIGPDAMVMGTGTIGGGLVQEMTLFSPGPSIYGGSDQVQKNILGERVLGLSKEPGPDKSTPFRELLVGTQRS